MWGMFGCGFVDMVQGNCATFPGYLWDECACRVSLDVVVKLLDIMKSNCAALLL